MTQTRFVVDRDQYQAVSPTLNATPVVTLQRYVQTPNLSWDFLTLAEPDGFDDYFAIADMVRVDGADFVVGGRRFGLFAHDFGRVPVDEWLELITERALAQEVAPVRHFGGEPLVLSHRAFEEAVRHALRDLHRPDRLAQNPSCRTRLVRPGGQTTRLPLRSSDWCVRRPTGSSATRVTTSAGGRSTAPTCDRPQPRNGPPRSSTCRSAPIEGTSPKASPGSSSSCGAASCTATTCPTTDALALRLSGAPPHLSKDRARTGLVIEQLLA
jgi:hypothetical protein